MTIERYGLSERQACRVVGLSRTAYRYTPKHPDGSQIKAQLQELAEWKPRRGFGKMFAYLRNQSATALGPTVSR